MTNDPTAGAPASPTPPTDPDGAGRLTGAQRDRLLGAFDELSSPQQIGPYRIIASVGQGGMGEVYKAEQREPIQRIVALKVIKLGMDTKEVIARFEGERQALAMMDHPNIARVFDAGATEAGRPYFVMEFVSGEPITEYCDKHQLTIRQRLELFVQVCDAVQHAHQKGIIHRDLKPSNILVTVRDMKATPKVIDFGVSKATRQHLTERTVFTKQGQLIGTPEYMSPEQAEMSALDIDTRSDVYSLGVVLYELLAGALPFEPQTLRRAALGEIQRIIREDDPPRPSTRLSSLDADRARRVASQRQSAIESLRTELRRELEWIPLKAMRKDRTQRYRAASEMADDVKNYLDGRPLIAGPESRAYRVQKFVRRNRLGVAATAAMLALLIAGIVTTSWQAIRARRAEARALAQQHRAEGERDNASATLDFLLHDVLAGATPDNIPDAKVRDQIVAAMITPAANRVDQAFKDRPRIAAGVHYAIYVVLWRIGRSDLALPHAEAAMTLARRSLGEDDPETITAMGNYAHVLKSLGRSSEAEPLFKKALDDNRRVLGDDHPDTIRAMGNYADVLGTLGRYAEAEPMYRQSMERLRSALGADDPDAITALSNYAGVLQSLGRLSEAEPLRREALERCRRVLGEDHPLTATALNNYAIALLLAGKKSDAEPLFKQSWELSRRVLGDDHPETFTSMANYGKVLASMDRAAEAEPLFRQALERRRRVLGADHPDAIASMSDLAVLLERLGRASEAEPLAREALDRATSNPSLGLKHPQTAKCAAAEVKCLEALDRHDQAAALRQRFALPATAPSTQPLR